MTYRLFIANRGEIALRIVRTARALDVRTVLGVSSADRESLAAQEADRVVVLGPPAARESYLNQKAVVHAAVKTGCDALHPGYGFLSERASFANLCADNMLIFVGPTAEQIERVGDKLSARTLARAAGAPLTSGSEKIADLAHALKTAESIGYPVITKASAGGGGRGMVVAKNAEALNANFDQAARTALEAFGDGALFLERYVETARHIEVQVFGDGRGNVVHFGERDCSIQRRYQKMIEEAPASILSDRIRERIRHAALSLLASINYRNAGTVEFLYDVDREEFYFMEVNARIQVEHPVSEEIAGVDLIRLQIKQALGMVDDVEQTLSFDGHAIEARILAEDPNRGFAPSPGRIETWIAPTGDGVRLDTAMHDGAVAPPYYDSMIGKLIVRGKNRDDAVKRLANALDAFQIVGIATNIPFLKAIVAHDDFRKNRIDTRWLERKIMPQFAS